MACLWELSHISPLPQVIICALCGTCWNAVVMFAFVFVGIISPEENASNPWILQRLNNHLFCQRCLLNPWISLLALHPPFFSSKFFPSFLTHCFCSYVWNRHSYAQFLLWRLQARAVRSAIIWGCDQIRVLLRQPGVRLRRALPALPTAKFWYEYSTEPTPMKPPLPHPRAHGFGLIQNTPVEAGNGHIWRKEGGRTTVVLE